ncbi:hypothetical protein PCC7424_0835 [Gloeothece citriformis PCC 7424]|uniref:Uncharacterized protein n=1 Tax=Gloeothece citriformis (strain PCC 7424) TaxID=65393 RepID=B7KH82_GLOC7|nr:hypothetical protein [Gloeothece citriformis]ACK69291.1 hypothetical protein PCC7424_0835 [Gloeothece citriformis PCC 7424]
MKSRRSKAIILSLIFAFVVGLIVATAPSVVMGANQVNTTSTEAAITQTLETIPEYTASNPIKESTESSYGCNASCNGKPGYISAFGRCIPCP